MSAPTSGRVFDGRESFGRYYEDFEVGDEYRHWPGRTITEADDTQFALLTMNQHPVHIDAHYASTAHHGQRLVVGTLVFSVVVGMTVRDVSGLAIANLSYDAVSHAGPTFHGDTLYARSRVVGKHLTSRPDRGVVEAETIAVNQHDKPVLSFRRAVLIPVRNPEAEA